jgi:hypothetical protein
LSNVEKNPTVSFKESVSVVLVPTREEYIKSNLANNLWYNESDYKAFATDAIREIDSYISINDSDLKSALSGLYQSRNESNSSKLSHISSSNISSSSISPDDEPQFVLDL